MWGEEELGETDETTDPELELSGGALALPADLLERVLSTEPTTPVRVRRITPVECERLQGFPDGWTVPTEEAMTRWGRSISTALDGTSSGALVRSLSSSGSVRASRRSSSSGQRYPWDE